MMVALSLLLACLAAMIMVIAALGLLRLPDALCRQHAATKAITLSISLLLIGLLFYVIAAGWHWGWVVRLVILEVILLITMPLASHALAKAASQENLDNVR